MRETINELLGFLNLFHDKFKQFINTVERDVFAGKAEEDIFFQADLMERKGVIAANVKSLMQFNRFHKLIGARVCEYVYVLRRSHQLIKTELVYKLFGKKNPFIDEQQKEPK